MNRTPPVYAKREVAQCGDRKVVVTTLVTPSTEQRAIEAPKG